MNQPEESQTVEDAKPPATYFPFNLTLDNYNYLGPGTPLTPEYIESHPPTNELDQLAYTHDLEYKRIGDMYANGEISSEYADSLVEDADKAMRLGIHALGKKRWTGIGVDEMNALLALQGKRLLESVGLTDKKAYLGVKRRLPFSEPTRQVERAKRVRRRFARGYEEPVPESDLAESGVPGYRNRIPRDHHSFGTHGMVLEPFPDIPSFRLDDRLARFPFYKPYSAMFLRKRRRSGKRYQHSYFAVGPSATN